MLVEVKPLISQCLLLVCTFSKGFWYLAHCGGFRMEPQLSWHKARHSKTITVRIRLHYGDYDTADYYVLYVKEDFQTIVMTFIPCE